MGGPVDTRHLRELDAQATPGPWVRYHDEGEDSSEVVCHHPGDDFLHEVVRRQVGYEMNTAHDDAELIVAARNSLPHLLDAAEERDRLLDELDQARAALRLVEEALKSQAIEVDGYYDDEVQEAFDAIRAALRGEGADGD